MEKSCEISNLDFIIDYKVLESNWEEPPTLSCSDRQCLYHSPNVASLYSQTFWYTCKSNKGKVRVARKKSLHVHRESSSNMQGRFLEARLKPIHSTKVERGRRRILEATCKNEAINETKDEDLRFEEKNEKKFHDEDQRFNEENEKETLHC